MKNIKLLAIIIVTILFSSCESDLKLGDFKNIMVQVAVENSQGQNLLDPTVEGNILSSHMYMIFRDEKYDIKIGWPDMPDDIPGEEVSTRMNMPAWYGAFIAPSESWFVNPENPDNNDIFIGEFHGGTQETTNLQLVILDKEYEISFKNNLKKNFRNEQTFYLDGKKQEGNIIKIII